MDKNVTVSVLSEKLKIPIFRPAVLLNLPRKFDT